MIIISNDCSLQARIGFIIRLLLELSFKWGNPQMLTYAEVRPATTSYNERTSPTPNSTISPVPTSVCHCPFRSPSVMIRDGYVTYADAATSLRNWRPESPLLHELLFAVSMTCLVYQVTKLVLEIFLGQRRRGQMQISDFYIYTVVSSVSFSSILPSLRTKRPVGGKRTKRKTPLIDTQAFHVSHIIATSKYITLLLVVPGIQILGTFLSIETERVLHFSDVNFGGMSMGLRDGRSDVRLTGNSDCAEAESLLATDETGMTDFFRCYGQFPIAFDNDRNFENNQTFIAILRSSPVDIGVTIVVPKKRWISFLTLDMYDRKQSYKLRNSLSATDRAQIFERGIQEMTKPCLSPTVTRGVDISWVIPPDLPQQEILSASVQCGPFDADFVAGVGNRMLDNVTFVETERFEIAESAVFPPEFRSADDIVFFQRHRSNALLLPTVIAFFAVLGARMLVRFALYVEGPLALEMILKDRFALKCCDSMLQLEQIVCYGSDSDSSGAMESVSSIHTEGDESSLESNK